MVEEYIAELARAIGDIYSAVNGGVGSEAEPKTALFEVYQLERLAQSQLPAFGILETTPAGFEVSYDNSSDPYFVTVSSGEVGYDGQRLVIPTQKVPIRRTFADSYGAGYQYGVRLGLPLSEAQRATESYSTVTSSATSANATELPVDNVLLVQALGFPISAHVNNVFVRFSGVNAAGTALVVDPGYDNGVGSVSDPNRYGRISPPIAAGSRVYFIYEPRVSALYGLPVLDSNPNPAAFHYYPPLPDDWLPIADLLCSTPEEPEVVSTGTARRTVKEFPAPDSSTPLFDTADANQITRVCRATRTNLRQARDNASVSPLLAALEEYTAAVSDSAEVDFRTYWSKRPFRPSGYFARGVSFAGLERFDFSPEFAAAYFGIRNTDVQHTFGIFRGDLYDYPYGITGGAPTGVVATSYRSDGVRWSGVSPNMVRGTYIYGVSAVTNNGETPVTYAMAVASYLEPSYFVNHVEFEEVSGALFYHVYRRSNLVGDQVDYRLTEPGEVSGYGKYELPSLDYDTTRTLSQNYEAARFVASGTRLEGVRLRIDKLGDVTNDGAYLTFAVYTDNAGAPGTLVPGAFENVTYGSLTVESQEVIVKGETKYLVDGNTYWLVIGRSAAPTGGGSIRLLASSEDATAQYATAASLGTWSSIDDLTVFLHPIFGYVDYGRTGINLTRRGVRLTGDTALEARRLRVYVPPIEGDGVSVGRDPTVAFEGDSSGDLSDPEDTRTKNELVVTVTARLGETGEASTFVVTVPRGTVRDTEFLIGTDTDLFDRVEDVQVTPGSDLRMDSNNRISWSVYDLVTVETVP